MNNIQELIKKFAQTQNKEFMLQIIEEMKTKDKLWIAYSPVTRNHYVEYFNGVPTAYVFSDLSFCEAFAAYLETKKIVIRPLESESSTRVPMFSDFFRNGIEQIIVDNGQTFIVIDLLDIIKRPDFSSLSEADRPLINPSMMKCANIFFQCMNMDEPNPNAENNLMREIFNSRYLLPIVFGDKAPKGLSLRPISVGGAAIQLAVIRHGDGKGYIPVFTDWVELGKYDRERLCCGNIVTFSDIETFCVNGEYVAINPLGFNMLLDKTTVESIRKRFDTPEEKEKTDRMGFFPVNDAPAPMMSKLHELFDKVQGINNAYLKGLRREGKTSYLVVVDFSGTNPAVFQQIAQQVGPLTGGKALNFVAYNSEIGKAASANTSPFYQRVKVSGN